MYLISVYPIAQLPPQLRGPFSYFTKSPIKEGAVVEITLKKKKMPALVASSEEITTRKIAIKKNEYALKKIDRVISPTMPFHSLLLTAVKENSSYYLEAFGSILKLFLPLMLLSQPASIPYHTPDQNILYEPEPTVVIGSERERFLYYEKIIRETFARNKSVALFVPTVQLAEHLFHYFKNLPKEIILLHGSLSKQQMRSALLRSQKRISPSLIIGTSLALGILNGDESVIIIEDADSRHYIKQDKPRIPTTTVIRSFAKRILAQAIAGKVFPSLEDISGNIPVQYLASRVNRATPPLLIDLGALNQEKFSLLTDIFKERLRAIEGTTILFTTRKGFYSFVICTDCGYLIACPSCSKPLTLLVGVQRRYTCRSCKKNYPPHLQCRNCNGWNLKGYGIGTERIEHEMKYAFPKRPLWILDEEHAKTKKDRNSIVHAFLASDGGILIGTEMILEEPELHAEVVAIISLDNLFSIPDFHMNERMLSLLFKLEEKSINHPIIIQTRFLKHPIFRHFINQDTKRLLETELAERKQENLPPYATLIRIAIRAKTQKQLSDRISYMKKTLTPFIADIELSPSFEQKEGPFLTHYTLLTVPKQQWQENREDLKNTLLAHTSEWDIAVDPPSIL